ncbi:hypothetical protein [Longispora albida]|uniref:hypothetical protein n=1 Tax=Longispora albida TaxID=203523 RepID=UPI00039C8F47|nr:hypothetical protein [Longispora albida]
MQPNPPQPSSPEPGQVPQQSQFPQPGQVPQQGQLPPPGQAGQPPMPGGGGGPVPWGAGPGPVAARPRPKPRANAVAALIAGIFALFTAAALAAFVLHDVVYATGTAGHWSRMVVVNVIGGVLAAGAVLVPAGFTVARRVPAAWTLCALCTVYVVSVFVAAPILFGTAFSAQFEFVFGFGKFNSIAAGLTVIFSALTAIAAAIAGSVKSYVPPRG